MAYSYISVTADGLQNQFSAPDYLDEAHIKVFIDGVEDTGFTWVNPNTIQTSTTPDNGALITVQRVTPRDALVTFNAPAILRPADLNRAILQVVYLMQEALDVQTNTIEYDPVTNSYDADNLAIGNVATPVAATDAATKAYVDEDFHLPDPSVATAQQVPTKQADGSLIWQDQVGLSGATFESLDANNDVGTGAAQVAQGNHNHDGVYSAVTHNHDGVYAPATHSHESSVPSGAIMDFAMSTPPDGWLECNGAAISRTTYANLFAAIGTTWGAGDGSTTFNVPNLRGTVRRSWDHGRGLDSGRAFASYQADNNKAHTHSGTTNANGNHRHSYTRPESQGFWASAIAGYTSAGGAYTSYAGDHSHSFETNSAGGSEATMKNYAVLTCIKT